MQPGLRVTELNQLPVEVGVGREGQGLAQSARAGEVPYCDWNPNFLTASPEFCPFVWATARHEP